MAKENHKNTGIFSLIVLTVLFASIGIFARVLQSNFAIFQQSYLRMFLALLLGFLFFFNDLHWSKLTKISKTDWIVLIARSFSYYFLGVILFTLAVFNTTLGNVSLIQALPFVAIFGILFFKEKLTLWKFIFLLLSFIGVAFISIHSFADIFIWGKGQTLSLISAVFFSFSFIARRWQSSYLNNKEMTQIMLFFAVIFLLVGSLFFKEGLPLHGWTWISIGALIISGLFNVAMLFLMNYGFANVKPLLASNLLTLEAFFAIILGFLLYKEIPNIKDILGGGLIIAAVIGMNYLEGN